jgi:tetratricopeptide (TPR) repeat protein
MKTIITLIFAVLFMTNNYGQTSDEYKSNGHSKIKSQDYSGAIAEFTKALKIYPQDKTTYYYRGVLKGMLEDYRGAIKDYTSALFNESNVLSHNRIFYMRAICKLQLNDYDGAIEDFNKELSDNLYPIKESARRSELYREYNNGGKEYTEQQNNKFKRDYAENYFGIGNARFYLTNYKGSVVSYSQAISIDPSFAVAYYKRARSKLKLEENEGALSDFSTAIELNPNDAESYFQRGLTKMLLNKTSSGCLDLSKAGELGKAQAYDAIKDFCH